jgi:hypothetical protein
MSGIKFDLQQTWASFITLIYAYRPHTQKASLLYVWRTSRSILWVSSPRFDSRELVVAGI